MANFLHFSKSSPDSTEVFKELSTKGLSGFALDESGTVTAASSAAVSILDDQLLVGRSVQSLVRGEANLFPVDRRLFKKHEAIALNISFCNQGCAMQARAWLLERRMEAGPRYFLGIENCSVRRLQRDGRSLLAKTTGMLKSAYLSMRNAQAGA